MEDRIYTEIKKRLSSLTLKDIVNLEKNDPQFKALSRLFEKYKANPVLFVKLVVINALLSYQLPMKGEYYWKNFADFFSTCKDINDFPEFLKRNNYRLLKVRLKRFEKARKAVNEIFRSEKDIKDAMKNLKGLVEKLSKAMNQKRDAKTIVFAVKMFIYACRIMYNENITAPPGIFIPLDSRIRSISENREFWKKLEKETGIPLIHIDAVLWLSSENVKK
ncbi:N-glycosylase/DNA lyase [Desulfurobacterium sp.]